MPEPLPHVNRCVNPAGNIAKKHCCFLALTHGSCHCYKPERQGVGMQMVIDRFGRMVLPKALRVTFGLHPGDVLEAEETADSIILRPSGRADSLRQKGRVLVFTGSAEGDVSSATLAGRRERMDRVAAVKHTRS